jgi:TRAP-type C4-dicarboxylate transport system substrate-binding protein
MKDWKSITSLFLCVSVIGFLFSIPPAFGQIKLNHSNLWPATHKHSVLAAEWAKEIEKRTNGRVMITVHHGGTLTPGDKCYDGVVRGISDIGMSVCGYTRGRFPLTEVIELPLGYKSGWVATRLITEYFNKFKPKEFDETKIMFLFAHGPGLLHSKKPLYKLEDLKGMKVRAFGAVTKLVTLLGGAPVSMPMGETYEALSRGVVEASVAPYEALQGWKWGEVVKYSTEAPGMAYSSAFFVAMNKNRWNALPPDIQKIIEQINVEYIVKHGKGWDEIDKAGKDFALKLGNKIITLPLDENRRWERVVKPLYDEYVKSMKDKGLPGDEVLRFCLETLYKLQR